MKTLKETPKAKHQTPSNLQPPNFTAPYRGAFLKIDVWKLFGVWCLAFGLSAHVRAAEISPFLSRFLSAQTNLHTWSADLTQIRQLKTLTQPLVSTGHVWFAAPNKFRWEIGSPAQTIAVRARHTSGNRSVRAVRFMTSPLREPQRRLHCMRSSGETAPATSDRKRSSMIRR